MLVEYGHLKLKVVGSADACARFHWLVGKLDPDYPMAPPRLRRSQSQKVCTVCGGLIYYTPLFTPMQLKEIGKQVNDHPKVKGHVKVKVVMFNLRCDGHVHRFYEESD